MILNITQMSIVAGNVLIAMEKNGDFTTKHELREKLEEESPLIDMGVGSLVKQGLVVVQPLEEDDYIVVRRK